MSSNDKDKLNRLEELKGKLFSKNFQTKIEHRNSFTKLKRDDIVESWEKKAEDKINMAEKFFMKTSMFKKFFFFSVIFFALALFYALYVFLAGSNTVSNNNIDISVVGNNFTAGGEELPLVIGITNKNSSSLDLVDLVIEYPKGSSVDFSSDTVRLRESLGTIPAGAVRNENIKLVLFGEQGSIRPIKITLEYRVSGSNAIFIKEKMFEVMINSTPINLTVEGPSTISPNQDIVLKVKASLNATEAAKKILVKIDYPVGFSFIKASPAPSYGNNIWSLGDLAPGSENEISVTGKLVDVFDGEEKTFNILSGSQSEGDKSAIGVVFNAIKNTLLVKKPFVEANLYINGEYKREYSSDAKSSINAEIRYVNNSDTKIDDLEIKAKISGNALNEKTIIAQQGYYDSSENTITWNRNSKNLLREVNPGDSGSVTFSFSPFSLYSASGGIISNPSINVEVDISGKQSVESFSVNELKNSSTAIVKIISDVGLSTKALHYSGSFENTGPIPPRAEQSTTYTIVWSLSNTANSLSKVRVNSTLPPWMSYTGMVWPQDENLTYNASTKEIVWSVDRVQKGAGITGAPRSVSFQVSLKPSVSHVGSAPVLVNDVVLTGHDDFANVDVKTIKAGINTRLDNDPSFPSDGSLVTN